MTTAARELHDAFRVNRAVVSLMTSILKPLVRMMLRLGVSCYAFTEIVRWLYVDIAMSDADFSIAADTPTTKSRAALLTGLSRREVLRLCDMPPPDSDNVPNYSRTARVLSGWMQDREYTDRSGNPVELPVKASHGPSFYKLVRDYAGDIPYRTVLKELVRNGQVRELKDGNLKMVKKAYSASFGSDDAVQLAGKIAGTLMESLEYDLRHDVEEQKLIRIAWSPRIPEADREAVKAEINKQSLEFNERIHKLILDHSDEQKKPRKKYTEVGLGLYYYDK